MPIYGIRDDLPQICIGELRRKVNDLKSQCKPPGVNDPQVIDDFRVMFTVFCSRNRWWLHKETIDYIDYLRRELEPNNM